MTQIAGKEYLLKINISFQRIIISTTKSERKTKDFPSWALTQMSPDRPFPQSSVKKDSSRVWVDGWLRGGHRGEQPARLSVCVWQGITTNLGLTRYLVYLSKQMLNCQLATRGCLAKSLLLAQCNYLLSHRYVPSREKHASSLPANCGV